MTRPALGAMRPAPLYSTDVFDSSDAAAQARVRAIIAANSRGEPGAPDVERLANESPALGRAVSVSEMGHGF